MLQLIRSLENLTRNKGAHLKTSAQFGFAAANLENADLFHRDLHKDLKADFVLANPPFNDSDWDGERLREDVRWKYGTPPVGNANFAWVQHFIHHLAPKGLVLCQA